jgi:hypothetical protein
MKNEMDALSMDERQRQSWLLANRATLMIVGLVWLFMIARALYYEEVPYFLIIMVPVFALVRFVAYIYYNRK